MKKTTLKIWNGKIWEEIFPVTYTKYIKRESDNKTLDDILDEINRFNSVYFPLKRGEVDGSAALKYGPDTDQKSYAYQKGAVALGGKTQAGFTKSEFDAFYTTKNAKGEIVDDTGKTWKDSYSFALSDGALSKAYARNSVAFGDRVINYARNSLGIGFNNILNAKGVSSCATGQDNVINAKNAFTAGTGHIVNYHNQALFGIGCPSNSYALLGVGNGTTQPAFEVSKDARCYSYVHLNKAEWYGTLTTAEFVKKQFDELRAELRKLGINVASTTDCVD